mgnify:CR=1 FL=1
MDIVIVGALAVFFGGILQGCLGFGFGLITVPPLLMVLTAAEVIPMQISLSLLLCLPLAWQARHHFEIALVVPLVGGAFLGIPIGMYVLHMVDGSYLKLAVGLILVVMTAVMLSGWSRPVKKQTAALLPIGFLSGIMQTAISMSGPPIILFLTNQAMEKERFRANMLIYFAFVSSASTIGFVIQGAYTRPILERMLMFTASLLIGGYIGSKIASRIPQEGFRTMTLIIAGIMGIILSVRNAAIVFGY